MNHLPNPTTMRLFSPSLSFPLSLCVSHHPRLLSVSPLHCLRLAFFISHQHDWRGLWDCPILRLATGLVFLTYKKAPLLGCFVCRCVKLHSNDKKQIRKLTSPPHWEIQRDELDSRPSLTWSSRHGHCWLRQSLASGDVHSPSGTTQQKQNVFPQGFGRMVPGKITGLPTNQSLMLPSWWPLFGLT